MIDFNFQLISIPTGRSKKSHTYMAIIGTSYGEAKLNLEKEIVDSIISESNDLRYKLKIKEKGIENETIELGDKIFKTFFKDDVFTLFNQSLGASESGRLNMRFLLGDVSFNEIHWELIRHKNEFLCFRHNIVRHPFISRPISTKKDFKRKLKVLVVATDPIYNNVDVQEEYNAIVNLLNGFGPQIELNTLLNEEATEENIMDILFGGIDIWHFCGHGAFDEKNPIDSFLVVWPEKNVNPNNLKKGNSHYGTLSIRTLQSLAINQNLGFCFLNACNTARSTNNSNIPDQTLKSITNEYFVNMAYSLIECGVPTVVATNHEITNAAAAAMAIRFYKSLLKYKKGIDEAIREARAELYILENKRNDVFHGEWSCPVLYSRTNSMGLGIDNLEWQEQTTHPTQNSYATSLHQTQISR